MSGWNSALSARLTRRRMLRNSLALGGLVGLGGCATAPSGSTPSKTVPLPIEDIPPKLAPVRAHPDRLFDITVCLRPFRPKGPRLDTEHIGDTLVVHNYGHGGSGWSLSWGSAAIAVGKAIATGPKEIAVIGCGAIGLTSAITAQRWGAKVTIYTRELLPRTRSYRATGLWTPDSRISLTEPAGPQFGALWEQMARTSFKTYRSYLGLPGHPVEWIDGYELSDIPFDQVHAADEKLDTLGFGNYSDRISDLTPRSQMLPNGANPFPVKYAQRSEIMMFNIPAYSHTLLSDFYAAGGKIEIREFHHPSQLGGLKEKVVINCPGYAARALWKDDSLVPVRGQNGWLIPQPEVNYFFDYKDVSVVSRRDGILIQALEGGDLKGYNDSNERVNRAESVNAVKVIESLYARFPQGSGA
jgi:glycine/D-amino acid oxidase-like deaminating enzyme